MADSRATGRAADRLGQAAAVGAAGQEVPLRASLEGDLHVRSLLTGRQAAALSGCYYTFTEGTTGTAVATTTSITGYDATKPVLLIHNNGTKDIVLDMVKFMVVQVPTSATSWQYWVKHYNGNVYASAGTAVTPTNANGNETNSSGAVVYIGAPVAAEGTATGRQHSGGALRGIIPTTFDSFTLYFGGDADGSGALLTSGSAKYNECLPPLVLAPDHSMTIGMFGASNAAAPSFRYSGGFYEV